MPCAQVGARERAGLHAAAARAGVFRIFRVCHARRWARASALAYMLLLHALVFFSMARLSHRHAAAVLPSGGELALLCQRAATRMAPPPPVT